MIVINALKDRAKTFDLAKFTAVTKKDSVTVIDGRHAIMSFNPQGDFSEVLAAPLKVSIAELVFTKLGWVSNNGYKNHIATAGLLKGFESRGGTL